MLGAKSSFQMLRQEARAARETCDSLLTCKHAHRPIRWTADHIEPEVFARMEAIAERAPHPFHTREGFTFVINHLLRLGLDQMEATAAQSEELF